MMQKLFALSLGFGGWVLATHHAFGQQPPQQPPLRGQPQTVVEALAQVCGESRRAIGLASGSRAGGESCEALNGPAPAPGTRA